MESFLWDLGDGTVITNTPTYQHTYLNLGDFYPSVIAIDSSGCRIPLVGNGRIHIRGLDADFAPDLRLLCDRGIVTFSDSTTTNNAPLQYQWQFGDGGTSTLPSPTHFYGSAGNYTVQLIVTTQDGCRDTIIKNNLVKVVERPHINVSGPTQACIFSTLQHQGSFIVPDTSQVSWQWNFPNGASSNSVNPPAQTYNTAGNFQIQVIATNSSGCKDTVNHPLRIDPLPVINLPPQFTVRNGFPVPMPVSYSPNVTQWTWSPPEGLSCIQCPRPDVSPKDDTRYVVQVQDANGCRNQARVLVLVYCQESNVFFPNTFSPNGDGSNDVYYPRGRGIDRIKSFQIVNRWGQVVFQRKNFAANDPSQGWDGKYLGQSPQADTYIFTAEVYCENGTLFTQTGNISLIR
jgi:gliding motility-associated-like protein